MANTSKDAGRQEHPRQQINGYWQLRVRSEVVVCPDCGALLPRSSNPRSCALCGSGRLQEN